MERKGHITLKGYRPFPSERKASLFSFVQEASHTKQHRKELEIILVWIVSTVVKT